MTPRPLPLSACPDDALRGVLGVFTDIDDTLTSVGAITDDALESLHRLAAAGVPVVPITGRSTGWSDPFARTWPVVAIVAENGAVAMIPERGMLHLEYAQDAPTRERNTLRLRATAERVLRAVPGATLAADSAGRITDIAVDHSEFAHLADEQIERVAALMREDGMTATVSSIHINGWFGAHDKLSGARWMVRRLYGRDLDAEADRWIYVGDSTNDQQMFGHFPLSVGVANLRDFAAQLHTWPAYLTEAARGAGFTELATRLLAARMSQ